MQGQADRCRDAGNAPDVRPHSQRHQGEEKSPTGRRCNRNSCSACAGMLQPEQIDTCNRNTCSGE